MRHSARHYSRSGQPTQANVSLNDAERLGKNQGERAFFECAVSGVQNLGGGNEHGEFKITALRRC
jgi:hypothetical protein